MGIQRFFRQFRLSWGAGCLMQTSSEPGGPGPSDAACLESSSARLDCRLARGWYMLEVELTHHRVRTRARIRTVNADGRLTASIPLDFPLDSSRVNKRLVWLATSADLVLELPLAERDVALAHFRLARAHTRFARSRMLMKLRALHPRYKSSLARHRLRGETDFADAAGMQALWADYCKLFSPDEDVIPYAGWVREFGQSTSARSAPNVGPLISLVMPLYNPTAAWLERAVASVQAQNYPHWQLCMADDASTDPLVRPLLEQLAQAEPRIQLVFRPENGHISAASNSAIAAATGPWLALLDHDDILAPDALHWVAQAIRQHPDCQLIYSDEDKLDPREARVEPYFKPDWNPDLFLSHNLFSHLGVYRTELVRSVGGFRLGYEGAQDHDLVLRCAERVRVDQIVHIPRVLYHWRMHEASTAQSLASKPYAVSAGERALNDHLQRTGANALARAAGAYYRVRYALPPNPPLVTLIIPTRNGLKLLRQCVESIFAKTDYPHYELVVVDNGSDDKATLRYLDVLSSQLNVRVMRDARPFNYSALNNAAVKLARGEVVCLLNNDVEVINEGWLTEMVSHALRPEIGAVGARLWYSDDTLQHAGVVLGIHGVAGHVHRFLPRDNAGYCGRAALIQSFSAVTGACLVVRKSLYEAVGGLNEVELKVACNDIDFCLKLRAAGYRNLWTPYAELYHHESASRGLDDTPEKLARSAIEVAYMKQHWGAELACDPAYNPNLTLDAEDFSLAWPPRLPEFDSLADAPGESVAGDVKAHCA